MCIDTILHRTAGRRWRPFLVEEGAMGMAFCEGDNAYVGFGSNESGYPTDWWHLNMATGAWTALTAFPGVGRNHPAIGVYGRKSDGGIGQQRYGQPRRLGGCMIPLRTTGVREPPSQQETGNHPFYFGIDGLAYVGFGHGNTVNGDLTIYRDFHRYNPVSDSWTPLGDFPGEARVAGTQFAKDGYGYVLSGDGDNHGPLDYGEFWKYDPSIDGWTELPAHPRRSALGSRAVLCWDAMSI